LFWGEHTFEMANQAVIALRRMETSQPWGFRLKGGTDQGMPLFVEHVQPKGRAAQAGLAAGDLVVAICGVSTQYMAHAQVKGEMLRAGNDLDLTIQRDGNIYVPPAATHAEAEPRVMIDDQPLPKLGGPTYKQVMPKTYQVLEDTLPAETAEDARPASIFDRKKQERSDYLKAKGSTIQKAFGEQHY
jgi:hypothetical protein